MCCASIVYSKYTFHLFFNDSRIFLGYYLDDQKSTHRVTSTKEKHYSTPSPGLQTAEAYGWVSSLLPSVSPSVSLFLITGTLFSSIRPISNGTMTENTTLEKNEVPPLICSTLQIPSFSQFLHPWNGDKLLPLRVFLKIKYGTLSCVLQIGKHCLNSWHLTCPCTFSEPLLIIFSTWNTLSLL